MENNESQNEINDIKETQLAYLNLISHIRGSESRLSWLAPMFIGINLFIIFFVFRLTTECLAQLYNPVVVNTNLFFVCLLSAIGTAVSTFWAAYAIRMQLKLRLRYFQARYLERKINRPGEYIISDEAIFFDKESQNLKSPDLQETLIYPKSGFLRMDGFIGGAKPHHFLLLMPSMFFCIHVVIFIWLIIRIVSY